jgi:protein-tyrosine kinase
MSKFFKALEQAQRDRTAAARQVAAPPSPAAAPAPPGTAFRPPAPPPQMSPEIPAGLDEEAPPSPAAAPPPPATAFRKPTPSPQLPFDIPDGLDDRLVSLLTPAAFEAEQYRALRYLVEQRHRADGLAVILVSSAGVGDGKTTTAVNLAGTLGQATDARVLLIEADLRRPAIGSLLGFGPGSRPGLVDAILDATIPLSQVVLPRPPFNLRVVLAGQTPPSPYEVLKSPRLGELLAEARSQYDYVVLDAPPLALVQDCRVLARWIDGVIFVVGAHHTPRRLVEEALNRLDPAKMLGFVFNGDDHGLARLYVPYGAAYPPRGAPAGPTTDAGTRWGRAVKKIGRSFARPDDADSELS